MMTYHYHCERSQLPKFQVAGMHCAIAVITGETTAIDVDDAWAFVLLLPCLPGVWLCQIRKGQRWLKSRWVRVTIDDTGEVVREVFAARELVEAMR